MNKLNNLTATKRTSPPTWAVLERQLIDAIDQTASIYIDKYTRSDGSLNWIKEYPGDGVWVDDLYEAFFNWPLYYSLGGSEYIGKKAVDQWNAVTRQVTDDYGRIADDFVCNDDWFHNAENYVYFYALGLSDPSTTKMMERARRFSGFYLAENKDIPNYAPNHHIIRSPISGSLVTILNTGTQHCYQTSKFHPNGRNTLDHGIEKVQAKNFGGRIRKNESRFMPFLTRSSWKETYP